MENEVLVVLERRKMKHKPKNFQITVKVLFERIYSGCNGLATNLFVCKADCKMPNNYQF